jgi:hypothetical protein
MNLEPINTNELMKGLNGKECLPRAPEMTEDTLGGDGLLSTDLEPFAAVSGFRDQILRLNNGNVLFVLTFRRENRYFIEQMNEVHREVQGRGRWCSKA